MTIETLSENNYLLEVIFNLHSKPWPEFLSYDKTVATYWRPLIRRFPDFQILCRVRAQYVAVGNAAPMHWDGKTVSLPSGFDDAVQAIMENPQTPNTLCGLAVVVAQPHHGRNISTFVLKSLIARAADHGFERLVLPVRPTLKSHHPNIPMEQYLTWQKKEEPFDPWLRIHHRLGGRVLKVAHNSMVVTGTVSQWEQWTGLQFTESKRYAVPGALDLVDIDLAQDIGIYREPNVWIVHDCL
jgi:GNAT superfamily N-acetyltransferase